MRLADCPSRDSGASAGGVEQRSRRPILTLVGLPSPPEDRPSRVASYWLRTLPPRPCPRGTEHRGLSRPGSPPEQSPEGTSRGVGPPFRVLPGCTARWLSPCFPRARAHGPGPPLLGFLAPTTPSLRVPHSATAGGADRRRREPPRSRRCRPRAFASPSADLAASPELTRVAPSPPERRLPRNSAAVFQTASVLGIRPTEPSPLEEPYRVSAADCSLASSDTTASRREGPGGVTTGFPRVPDRCRASTSHPAGRDADRGARVPRDRSGRPAAPRVAPRNDQPSP